MRSNKLIQLYIDNVCNSHCKTCSIWKNRKSEFLPVSVIERVVRAFPEADYVIGGGEAILHPGIEEILEMLRRDEIKYTLLSNCINLERLEFLVKKYNVPAVTVSFDGTRHDIIRGVQGNSYSILLFEKWCHENGVRFKISYTYSKYNEATFEIDMVTIKDLYGQDKIYFCLAQDMRLLNTQECEEDSPIADSFDKILNHKDMLEDKDIRFIKGMINGVRSCCDSQTSVHTIYSNGDIVRCQSYLSHVTLGNIKDMTSLDIKQALEDVKKINCPYDAECNLLCQRRYD